MMHRFRSVIFVGLMILWNSGCGPTPVRPPEASSVAGTITLDGKQVPKGEVHFSTLGAPPGVMEIADGYFSGEAPVGDNQVEVYIYVEGPPSPRFPDVPTKTNVAPEKYWGPKTILKAKVNGGESNEFQFKLLSK